MIAGAAALLLSVLAAFGMAARTVPPLEPAAAARLCVTLGEVGRGSGAMRIETPKVRAVTSGDPSRAELRFVYRGPTAATAALASGGIRRQIGLKLRAANGCNVLYVMWRLDPEARLVVSTKQNEGQSVHAECGTHGYTNLRASRSAPLPAVAPGSAHVLRAALEGETLSVQADGATVWEGPVPLGSVPATGAVGFRTDNVRVDVDLRVARGDAAGPACAKGDE